MSIKKLFDSDKKNINYSDYKDDKTAYELVESRKNAQITQKNDDTVYPRVNYENPATFAKFGSAELYYQASMDKIVNYYPYDGSHYEKEKFYEGLSEIEKHIFNKKYPRTNGFVNLSATGWGTLNGSITSDGYGNPTTVEYITFKGGPGTGSNTTGNLKDLAPTDYSNQLNKANIYDIDIYGTDGKPTDYGLGTRLSNLRSNFDDGVTVEFWLKKDSFDNSKTTKEVVLDIWNNELTSSDSYGRITIELTGAATGSPFLVTAQSGTTRTSVFTSSIGDNVTSTSLQSWAHYALSMQNSGSKFVAKFYVDGKLNDTNKYNLTIPELNSKNMMGRIGALLTSPSGSTAPIGAGKLSASLDEFRFWKEARNSKLIDFNWFTNVDGGTNTDISNTTLGLYYKFNEGITNSSNLDSVVLDYAGRVTNGIWTGYTGLNARNTASAMVTAGAATKEYLDPIVRSSHPEYTSLRKTLIDRGRNYDASNNSTFANYAPNWVNEEHDDVGNLNLRYISHIFGSYMDKIYLLAAELPKAKQAEYLSGSSEVEQKPYPFSNHLPQSLGLYVPEIFIDAEIHELLYNRDTTRHFENSLQEAKNAIYSNIYNNLANIYKAKGTEKAIRNIFRCYNLDDKLIKFKSYADETTYEIKNNVREIVVDADRISLNNNKSVNAVIYQKKNSANADSSGYISGSYGATNAGVENPYGFTMATAVVFPRYYNLNDRVNRSPNQISLFGLHTVDTGSADSLDGTTTTTLTTTDYANFQVYAIRDDAKSKNVRFVLTSSGPGPIPELSSSTFLSVYDENKWNLSVRLKPSNFPFSGMVSGAAAYTYDVIFRGTSHIQGTVSDTFEVSSSVTFNAGSKFLQSPKRIYVGARRENITGTVLYSSDVMYDSARVWTKYVTDNNIDQHLLERDNSAISGTIKHISPLEPSTKSNDLLNINTLALDWTFANVTGSDAAGNFVVQDYSSGSATLRENFSWLGKISGYQHSGYGHFFPVSSTEIVDKSFTTTFKFIDPEETISSDMISILSEDDEYFERYATPPDYIFTVEKSMYAAISEEMLQFVAGVSDFNNIIGEPVSRYRTRYKNLELLREIFFRRVSEIADVEKYINYYKWLDDSINAIVSQLLPASAQYTEELLNVVESHTLERNKYENKFPTIEFRDPKLVDIALYGWGEMNYKYDTGSPPVEKNETLNTDWWFKRAERYSPELSSSVFGINNVRDVIREVINSEPALSQSGYTFSTIGGTGYSAKKYERNNFIKLVNLEVESMMSPHAMSLIHGGVNFEPSKKIDFTYSSLRPAGPIDTTGGRFVPQNILLGLTSDLVGLKDSPPNNRDPIRPPNKKIKRRMKVAMGREHRAPGNNYTDTTSTIAFPFNIISSSLKSGYQSIVQEKLASNAGTIKNPVYTYRNLEITNLHNDVYGPDMEKPMQGTFTEYAVGGHQSRHVPVNFNATDTWHNRPEAWYILLGSCNDSVADGIGMVGPDYPWPDANTNASPPYPATGTLKAPFYRDQVAKRPVNIKNMRMVTGSTILGNFRRNYEVVNAVGASANPRKFIDKQPTLSPVITSGRMNQSTVTNTLFDVRRLDDMHFEFVTDYSLSYLTASTNKTIIRNTFGAPGGIETGQRYSDFRSAEFTPYNAMGFRNLLVIKPLQLPMQRVVVTLNAGITAVATQIPLNSVMSLPKEGTVKIDLELIDYTGINKITKKLTGCSRGSHGTEPVNHAIGSLVYQKGIGNLSETTGSGGLVRLRISDIAKKDYGLVVNQATHCGKFGRDSRFILDGYGTTPGADGEIEIGAWHKIHRNRKKVIRTTHNGTYYTGSSYDNYFIQHPIPRSTTNYRWIGKTAIKTPYGYGYAPESFFFRYKDASTGNYLLSESISFISASEYGSYLNNNGDRTYGDISANVAGTEFVPNDFVGLNMNIAQQMSELYMTIGNFSFNAAAGEEAYQGISSSITYLNTSFVPGGFQNATPNPRVTLLNGIIHNRRGAWGQSSWEYGRNSENRLLKHMRRNNWIATAIPGPDYCHEYDRTFILPVATSSPTTIEAGLETLTGIDWGEVGTITTMIPASTPASAPAATTVVVNPNATTGIPTTATVSGLNDIVASQIFDTPAATVKATMPLGQTVGQAIRNIDKNLYTTEAILEYAATLIITEVANIKTLASDPTIVTEEEYPPNIVTPLSYATTMVPKKLPPGDGNYTTKYTGRSVGSGMGSNGDWSPEDTKFFSDQGGWNYGGIEGLVGGRIMGQPDQPNVSPGDLGLTYGAGSTGVDGDSSIAGHGNDSWHTGFGSAPGIKLGTGEKAYEGGIKGWAYKAADSPGSRDDIKAGRYGQQGTSLSQLVSDATSAIAIVLGSVAAAANFVSSVLGTGGFTSAGGGMSVFGGSKDTSDTSIGYVDEDGAYVVHDYTKPGSIDTSVVGSSGNGMLGSGPAVPPIIFDPRTLGQGQPWHKKWVTDMFPGIGSSRGGGKGDKDFAKAIGMQIAKSAMAGTYLGSGPSNPLVGGLVIGNIGGTSIRITPMGAGLSLGGNFSLKNPRDADADGELAYDNDGPLPGGGGTQQQMSYGGSSAGYGGNSMMFQPANSSFMNNTTNIARAESANSLNLRSNAHDFNEQIKVNYGYATLRSDNEDLERLYYGNKPFSYLSNFSKKQIRKISNLDKLLLTCARNPARTRLNWLKTEQNIFPASINLNTTAITNKTTYNNNYWRSVRINRATGSTNAFGVTFTAAVNSGQPPISQSIFCMDPPQDFLTRTAPANVISSSNVAVIRKSVLYSGSAGQLQNTYVNSWYSTNDTQTPEQHINRMAAGPLFARKQMLSNPMSLTPPWGPANPLTKSSLSYTNMFAPNQSINIQGGEAVFQAPALAGIVTKDTTTGLPTFLSYSSAPWYDSYTEFRDFGLKNTTKNMSILAEYRVSEHIPDYLEYGKKNVSKKDSLEIPETNINSTDDSFYTTYSNSDFLTDVMKIKNKSRLNPSEIRLNFKAAIKFNPYKGFYPAQRTIQLVEKFNKNYKNSFMGLQGLNTVNKLESDDNNFSMARNFIAPLFAPGILYNSIKSAVAVDYPVLSNLIKRERTLLSQSYVPNNYAIVYNVSSSNSASNDDSFLSASDAFWDDRLPFETILHPESINDLGLLDLESHPSATLDPTTGRDVSEGVMSTITSNPVSPDYSLAMSNFLGGVADFFLEDSQYTRLESNVINNDLRFKNGDIFISRLKFYRSTNGNVTYDAELSTTQSSTVKSAFTRFGMRPYINGKFLSDNNKSFVEIPQYPLRTSGTKKLRETMTTYSRTTAFGPSVAGVSGSDMRAYETATVYDSFTGCNPAFTDSSRDGEGWADFIFIPSSGTVYDLERILAETKVNYWRFDPGYKINGKTQLIYDSQASGAIVTQALSPITTYYTASTAPYSGQVINKNSMQLDATFNLFGIERVQFESKDDITGRATKRNTSVGQKWVIQSKFETPALNFSDFTARSLSGTIDLPLYASESVPRGMWHQFGLIPESDQGLFLEFTEPSRDWFKYHYMVRNENSVYNNNDAATTGKNLHKNVKSFKKLFGFNRDTQKAKVGQLKETLTVKEAIVAIPYTQDQESEHNNINGNKNIKSKNFITIPMERIEASLDDLIDTKIGDSLSTAGRSIREQVERMQEFILPPQFDFLNDRSIKPIVMYVIPFEYTFDKDDLSYIWQNIAPRNSREIEFQEKSVCHTLANNELFCADNVIDNDNLHWMVFKVKQRVESSYYDKVISQAGEATSQEFINTNKKKQKYHYNWPYDYFSFVELGALSVDLLYKPDQTDAASMQRSQMFENKLRRMTSNQKYNSIKRAEMTNTIHSRKAMKNDDDCK